MCPSFLLNGVYFQIKGTLSQLFVDATLNMYFTFSSFIKVILYHEGMKSNASIILRPINKQYKELK
jgi:type II secretory pathway component PulC